MLTVFLFPMTKNHTAYNKEEGAFLVKKVRRVLTKGCACDKICL